MSVPLRLDGQRFGKFTVLDQAETIKQRTHWRCRCDCGNERVVVGINLRNGNSTSCGCGKIRHGGAKVGHKHPLYGIWLQMRSRCNSQRNPKYNYYGGRGITVCDRWQGRGLGFANFVADMGPRPLGMTLDRVNNDGPYSPENCRWATRCLQMTNTRRSRTVLINGEPTPLVTALKIFGVHRSTFNFRQKKLGQTDAEALTGRVG